MDTFKAIEALNATQQLSIKTFEDGTIKIEDILSEVEYLKQNIDIIRQQMSVFLVGLADIQQHIKPQQLFDEQSARVADLQKSLDDYVERYKKLIPLLKIVRQELQSREPKKQEPSFKPALVSTASALSAAAAAGKKQQTQRKRTYKKKDPASQMGTPANITINTPPVSNNMGNMNAFDDDIPLNSYRNSSSNLYGGSGSGSGSGNNGNSANQPIIL